MTITIKTNIILIAAFFTNIMFLNAQELLKNPSFEDETYRVHFPPIHWKEKSECLSDPFINSPDAHSFYGNSFNKSGYNYHDGFTTKDPTDGDIYMVIKARGNNHPKPEFCNITESMGTKLIESLKKNNCYSLSIDLSYAKRTALTSNDTSDQNRAWPMHFMIYGTNFPCEKGDYELLSKSELIDHEDWQRYEFNLVPKDNYSYLVLGMTWEKGRAPYNGIIFMDNANLKSNGFNKKIESEYYFNKDEPNILTPKYTFDNPVWVPTNNLSCMDCDYPVLLQYDGDVRYTYIAEIAPGCRYEEAINIKYNCPPIESKTLLDTIIAKESEISLNSRAIDLATSWIWKNNYETICNSCEEITVKPLNDKTYILSLYDEFNCESKELYTFKIHKCQDTTLPKKEFETNYNEPVSLKTDLQGENYTWNPPTWLNCNNCKEVVAIPEFTTEYSVFASDKYHCLSYQQIKVKINLFIPNVITPNEDGYNDVFKIPGLPPKSRLAIYTRNNELLYHSDDYNQDWGGLINGNKLTEQSTYWYVLTIKPPDTEEEETYTGFVYVSY